MCFAIFKFHFYVPGTIPEQNEGTSLVVQTHDGSVLAIEPEKHDFLNTWSNLVYFTCCLCWPFSQKFVLFWLYGQYSKYVGLYVFDNDAPESSWYTLLVAS